MPSPGCLWNRPRLERLVDGALGPWTGRVAAQHASRCEGCGREVERLRRLRVLIQSAQADVADPDWSGFWSRSEEHTSELQSLRHLVCRLLLEKQKKNK